METDPRHAIDHPIEHYTIDIDGLCQANIVYQLNSLPKYERHQQRSFFQQRSLERTMDCVIRREIVVARSGGFSEIVVARSGGFRDGG